MEGANARRIIIPPEYADLRASVSASGVGKQGSAYLPGKREGFTFSMVLWITNNTISACCSLLFPAQELSQGTLFPCTKFEFMANMWDVIGDNKFNSSAVR